MTTAEPIAERQRQHGAQRQERRGRETSRGVPNVRWNHRRALVRYVAGGKRNSPVTACAIRRSFGASAGRSTHCDGRVLQGSRPPGAWTWSHRERSRRKFDMLRAAPPVVQSRGAGTCWPHEHHTQSARVPLSAGRVRRAACCRTVAAQHRVCPDCSRTGAGGDPAIASTRGIRSTLVRRIPGASRQGDLHRRVRARLTPRRREWLSHRRHRGNQGTWRARHALSRREFRVGLQLAGRRRTEETAARRSGAGLELARNQPVRDQRVHRLVQAGGTEPLLAFNLGTGTPDTAVAYVESCNVDKGTKWSELRRSHGYDAPHNVRYWCLGNEMDGPWQMGHMSAREYGRKARDAARQIRVIDPRAATHRLRLEQSQ